MAKLVSVLPFGDIVCLKCIIRGGTGMSNQSRREALGNFGDLAIRIGGGLLILFFVVNHLSGGESSGNRGTITVQQNATTAPDTTTVEAEDVVEIKNYQDLAYSDIARQKDGMEGEHIYFTGQVIQTGTSWGDVYARVAKNGVTDEIFYVNIAEELLDVNLLEDDYIYIEGTLTGLKTYTSVFGSQVTIPEVEADLVELQ